MRYLAATFRTGSSPDAPDPPPDPKIAEEKARREAVALMQADRRRRGMFGSSSTVLTQGGRPGTALTRPTESVTAMDPDTTTAGRKKAFNEAPPQVKFTDTYQEEGRPETRREIVKYRSAPRKTITEEEMTVFNQATKDQNIAKFIDRRRSRLGVMAS